MSIDDKVATPHPDRIATIKSLEPEYTVDEMIGIVKFDNIMVGKSKEKEEYLDLLLEWRELGSGECTVANCREEIMC